MSKSKIVEEARAEMVVHARLLAVKEKEWMAAWNAARNPFEAWKQHCRKKNKDERARYIGAFLAAKDRFMVLGGKL